MYLELLYKPKLRENFESSNLGVIQELHIPFNRKMRNARLTEDYACVTNLLLRRSIFQ
jgi:hypothetical protein